MATFITLKVTCNGYDALNIQFDECSYDHTRIAVQNMVDGFKSMMAGDPVVIDFIHAREEYSARFKGVMPRHDSENEDWREFAWLVRRATH